MPTEIMRFEFYHDIHSYTLSRKKRSGIINVLRSSSGKTLHMCAHRVGDIRNFGSVEFCQ